MRFSLFGDRLRLSSDVDVRTSDSSLALADALRERPETGAPTDLFDARPGVRVRLGGAAVSGVTLGEALAAPDAPTDLLRRPLAGAASAELSARVTSGPVSLDVRVDAAASANALATRGMFTQLEPVFRDAFAAQTDGMAIYEEAMRLQDVLMNGPLIGNFQAALRRGDRTQALLLGAQLLDHLNTARNLLSRTIALGERLDTLLASVETRMTGGGGAAARGTVDIDTTLRTPRVGFRGDGVAASFGAAITIGGSVPIPNPEPEAPTELGLRPLRTLAAAVDTAIEMSTEGVTALREQLAEIAPELEELQRLGLRVNVGLSQVEAERLENRARELETSLRSRADRLMETAETAHADVAARMRVSQATGPAIGIRAIGVNGRVSFDEWFSAEITLALRNPIGVMPGEVSDYAIGPDADGSYRAHLLSTRSEDIYSRLFPRAFTADLRLLAHPARDVGVELRGSVDMGAAHTLLSASMTLSMYGFFVGGGASTAIVGDTPLATEVGASIGYRTPEGHGLSLSAGMNPEALGSTDALSSASGRLSLTLPLP